VDKTPLLARNPQNPYEFGSPGAKKPEQFYYFSGLVLTAACAFHLLINN